MAANQELCPYCFEYFSLAAAPFRCSNRSCKTLMDPILQKVWNDSRPKNAVFEAVGREESQRCPDCRQVSHKRICPNCHMELPSTLGKCKNYIFSVIGAKAAGKSHYIAVLIDQIKRRIGPEMNILLEAINDETITRYREEFHAPLFVNKRTIESTQSGLTMSAVRKPMLFSLTFSSKNFFGKTKITGAIVLVFFDTAGEDMNEEDTMATVNKYIYRSNGIILLVDPLQIPHVRDHLKGLEELPQQNTESAEILTRTTRLIEGGCGYRPTDRINIPLAVAFSKIDALSSLIDPQFQVSAASNHRSGFDRADFEAVNTEMMSLLADWQCADIVQSAQTRYTTCGFFGLTALGCNPQGGVDVPRILPRRVEDPFLWLLHCNKLLNAKTH